MFLIFSFRFVSHSWFNFLWGGLVPSHDSNPYNKQMDQREKLVAGYFTYVQFGLLNNKN